MFQKLIRSYKILQELVRFYMIYFLAKLIESLVQIGFYPSYTILLILQDLTRSYRILFLAG